VNSETVQNNLRQAFFKFNKDELHNNEQRYPNLVGIIMLIENERLGYKELSLINEILPNLCSTGLDAVENGFEDFINVVQAKSQKSDVTWQEILKSFDYQPEVRKIERMLEQPKPEDLKTSDDDA